MKEKFDVVMCYQTSPVLMANAAKTYAKKNKVPFFLYCLDLWPESLKAWHVGEGNPLFKLMHKYSMSIYNGADLVGVTSKPFMNYLQTVDKVPMDKMVYLPQHAEPLSLEPKEFDGKTVTDVPKIVEIIKSVTDTPVVVAVSNTSAYSSAKYKTSADGIIVGNGTVQIIGEHGEDANQYVYDHVKLIVDAID
jgi:hypothetical protein